MSNVVEETHFQFLWLLYVAYVIIVVASLFGNSVIIYIIRTDDSMKTTTNYFILNQACADLLITLAELVNVIHYSYMNSAWFGGDLGQITCKFYRAILLSLPVFSIWILVMISIDRFYAVTRPLRASPVSQHFKKVIVLVWVSSLFSPTNFLRRDSFKKSSQYYYCVLVDVLREKSTLGIITSILNAPLPLSIIAVMYTNVCLKLWSRKVPGEGSDHSEQQSEAVKTAKKVTLMMIVIVMLFVLCWFPLLILGIFQYMGHFQLNGDFLLFIIWLTVAYSSLNPYVYFIFSQNFRNGLKTLFINFLGVMTFCNINILSFRNQNIELRQV